MACRVSTLLRVGEGAVYPKLDGRSEEPWARSPSSTRCVTPQSFHAPANQWDIRPVFCASRYPIAVSTSHCCCSLVDQDGGAIAAWRGGNKRIQEGAVVWWTEEGSGSARTAAGRP